MKVSILINNFNNGPWLRECVDSALNQTRPADEIIVYDDGSTDDSLPLLRSYGDRIMLIEGVHDDELSGIQSQARAIYTSFLASTGDHLHLLDGDDAYLPQRIESYEQVWLTQLDAGMVQGPRKITHGASMQFMPDPHVLISPEKQLAWIYRNNRAGSFYPTSSLAFSREFLQRHLPLNLSNGLPFACDYHLATLALLTSQILLASEPQTIYRLHPSSISALVLNLPPAQQTRLFCKIFNLIAAQCGKPQINYRFDPRYHRQRLRELAPKCVGDLVARFYAK